MTNENDSADCDPGNDVGAASDARLIDLVKEHFDIKTDQQAALFVGIDPALVHNMRAGKRKFGPVARLKIFDRLGYAWARSALIAVLPTEAAKVILKNMNKHSDS